MDRTRKRRQCSRTMKPETLKAMAELVRAAAKMVNPDRDESEPVTFTVCRPVNYERLGGNHGR